MNFITDIFNNLNPAEQAALQQTHDTLAPQWIATTDPVAQNTIALQFTEALNTFRSTES